MSSNTDYHLRECALKENDRLGTLFNAIPGEAKKQKVEEWAKAHYARAWSDLEKLGRTKNRYGREPFNIDRSVKA